jgi:hypothetical protein
LHVDVVVLLLFFVVFVILLPDLMIIVFYIWQRCFAPVIIQALNLTSCLNQ